MTAKTAYVWGPVSNLSSALMAVLLENGWHLHLASKSALQLSLSPLDLPSSAQHQIEKAIGKEKFKLYQDKLHFLDGDEPQSKTNYDVFLFMGLPLNFDEPRVSRSPWAAEQFAQLSSKLKNVPAIIISSLWGGIQEDGIVPEEIEFDRRKALTHFEGVCQQYESRILKSIGSKDGKWHLLRLPLILGNSSDGRSQNFTGPYRLLKELYLAKSVLAAENSKKKPSLELSHNPDATLWMLPNDTAAGLLLKLIEDQNRPTICNLVSTQAKLNQEWLQDLSSALGFKQIKAAEKDNLNLPGTIRSMLCDNIQVKSRNLFELMGRHQQSPIMISADYFKKVIDFAAAANWGELRKVETELPFSAEAAKAYFEGFLPSALDKKSLKALSSFNGGLAFEIKDQADCRWLLEAAEDSARVTAFDPDLHKPQAKFLIGPAAFAKICSGKMLFEQALLTRNLQTTGGPLQSLKACDFFRRFLRKHHFDFAATEAESADERILETAVKD